jgi:hypothetical protein
MDPVQFAVAERDDDLARAELRGERNDFARSAAPKKIKKVLRRSALGLSQ